MALIRTRPFPRRMHHISDKPEVYDQPSIDGGKRSSKPGWSHRRTRRKYRGNKKAGRIATAPSTAPRTGGIIFSHTSSNLETGTQSRTRRTSSRGWRATRRRRGRRSARGARRVIPTSTKMRRGTRRSTTGGRRRRGARAPPTMG